MSSRALIIAIVAILILIGGYFLLTSRASSPEAAEEAASGQAMQAKAPSADAVVVTYTDGGFSPASTTVSVGHTVRFVNNSSEGLWVGVDEHPTHTEYDGSSTQEHCVDGTAINGVFDMCRRSTPGEFWDYTFTKAGIFDYHNHASAEHGGTIVVTN